MALEIKGCGYNEGGDFRIHYSFKIGRLGENEEIGSVTRKGKLFKIINLSTKTGKYVPGSLNIRCNKMHRSDLGVELGQLYVENKTNVLCGHPECIFHQDHTRWLQK